MTVESVTLDYSISTTVSLLVATPMDHLKAQGVGRLTRWA